MTEESPHDESLREALRQEELHEATRRRFVYADVEAMARFGFLSHLVEVERVPILLRTIPTEGRVRMQHREMLPEVDYVSWTIAEAVYMLNGIPIEPNSDATYFLYEWAQSIPQVALSTLFSVIRGLHTRFDRAMLLVEAFSYEAYSRNLWRSNPLPEPNLLHDAWASLNRAEDEVERSHQNWRYIGTLASSWSKGGKSILDSVDRGEERERSRRQRAIEESVNNVLREFRSDREMLKVEVNGKVFEVPSITSAQTTEDLFGEMRRVMTGKGDYHDEVIMQYKRSIRERMETQRRANHERMALAQQVMQEEVDAGRPPVVGYTLDQIGQFRPEAAAGVPSTPKITDASSASHLFDRYLSAEQPVGWIGSEGRPEPARLAKEPQPDGEAEGQSLQDRIAAKRPTLRPPT